MRKTSAAPTRLTSLEQKRLAVAVAYGGMEYDEIQWIVALALGEFKILQNMTAQDCDKVLAYLKE